jgi:trehalose utilization protein
MFNDSRNINICHNDAPTLEGDNVTNVFWLTPRHSRYVVPKYFPPTIVERAKNSLETHPNPKPVFLVTGSFSDSRKRNTNSLKHAMQAHRNKDFIIRFLGGDAFHGGEADVDPQRHESLVTFVNQSSFDPDKVQLLSHLNDTAFMNAVEHVDVILPLVDETNFYNTYEGGKKLTSAVTWGLGFGKKLVIYKPLAELFGIPDDRLNYWHYENSTVFANAFGECLNELDAKQ